MSALIDLTGQRFERLLVLERGENNARGHSRWVCRCDCGRTKLVWATDLRGGRSRSCGCLRVELVRASYTTHGHTWAGGETAEYRAWAHMRDRCYNPRRKDYRHYGGRGITVCPRWRESFQAFFDDMGPKPSPDLTLDRKDNDGNYEPGNVRWATRSQQNSNQRKRETSS